jgi:hypothetical protein
MTKALMGTKASVKVKTVEEKLAKLNELPTVSTPESLPGDCAVKEYVLEHVTPCKFHSQTPENHSLT